MQRETDQMKPFGGDSLVYLFASFFYPAVNSGGAG